MIIYNYTGNMGSLNGYEVTEDTEERRRGRLRKEISPQRAQRTQRKEERGRRGSPQRAQRIQREEED
jgi:hypothetical protein